MGKEKDKKEAEKPLLIEWKEDDLEVRNNKLTVEELREIFDLLADGKDYVTAPKLILALRKYPKIAEVLHLPSDIQQENGSREIFEEWFQSIDSDESRTLTWEEFAELSDENLEETVYIPPNKFKFKVRKIWKCMKKPFVKCLKKPKIDKDDAPVEDDKPVERVEDAPASDGEEKEEKESEII
mmetsp:Transcript_25355/g.55140  ORF Transcript_25355/g.55140 Transcript_25355/m.55140 type:complete len:183 (-) Transcript_25355:479-1027(-)|eukprot:CAMPEP_0118932060 /NCGR_PEP_ID=MMETSP1169-20130426/8982_1 /TAXON_ID=36882 /ORGANISM="Pyramimonas obovata, Strain CCMP722" /LENGTH=182 /DNA_ID=CAMNT_0006874655 /DNA_START=64 /DNA_END=612 /DNA_ORIENTATION=-